MFCKHFASGVAHDPTSNSSKHAQFETGHKANWAPQASGYEQCPCYGNLAASGLSFKWLGDRFLWWAFWSKIGRTWTCSIFSFFGRLTDYSRLFWNWLLQTFVYQKLSLTLLDRPYFMWLIGIFCTRSSWSCTDTVKVGGRCCLLMREWRQFYVTCL